jgi:hypothetical protein
MILSIQVTVAVVSHVFHTRSEYVKVKLPFDVNIYHVAFIQVNVSEYQLSNAITS